MEQGEWATRHPIRWSFRRATASQRLIPSFLIIGAQKAGTSSLHSQLVHHPQVLPSLLKEVHYFDLNYPRGINWYRTFFPIRLRARMAAVWGGQPAITGESSPYYLFHPHVPRRVERDFPGIPLIVLLRDPVERAYSHYQHARRHGMEQLTFAEALAQEDDRIGPDREKLAVDENWPAVNLQNFSYRSRGVYVDQLMRWMPVYDSRRLLVLRSEDFFADPGATLIRVLEFLRLKTWQPGRFAIRNRGNYAHQATPQHEELRAFYAPHNRRLAEWLGFDLGW
jgi:hypothetical protein